MAYFDRFDICEAYYQIEVDYHVGGWLRERPSNQRRRESTDVQLSRMGFKPGAGFQGFESLSENGQEIYRELERRYGLRRVACSGQWTGCRGARVAYIDEKGFAYCAVCGPIRKGSGRRCRKLRLHEIRRLEAGKPLTRY